MTECIILAGGISTRMGTNKMLLEYKGHPLIWHTIQSVAPFVSKIIIVTGKYDQEIRDALKDEKVSFVYNKDYELGMFSSVLAGVKETSEDFLFNVEEDKINKVYDLTVSSIALSGLVILLSNSLTSSQMF